MLSEIIYFYININFINLVPFSIFVIISIHFQHNIIVSKFQYFFTLKPFSITSETLLSTFKLLALSLPQIPNLIPFSIFEVRIFKSTPISECNPIKLSLKQNFRFSNLYFPQIPNLVPFNRFRTFLVRVSKTTTKYQPYTPTMAKWQFLDFEQ